MMKEMRNWKYLIGKGKMHREEAPKKKSRKNLLLILLVFLTGFRFYLGIKTPVYLQADASMDDFLYIQYAANLLSGRWLGDFSSSVLLKTVSPAFLLAANYVLGIPYPVSLAIGYLLAVFLFSLAMCRLVKSRGFAIALYVFLLYSPGMFHEENVQKVYRGGYIVIFALLVFASVIGQYGARESSRKREVFLWSFLGCVSLPVFYYLKEDSVWILPFVCAGTACTLSSCLARRFAGRAVWPFVPKKPGTCGERVMGKNSPWEKWRIAAAVSPLLALACASVGYRMVNYHYYGVYAITDRSGTYCKEALSDLLQVDDGEGSEDPGIWVTRNMIGTAAKHSQALEELLPYVEQSWNQWFGEGKEAGGDFYIWAFRGAMELSGAYEKGGPYVDSRYQQIHEELQKAYDSGALKRWEGRIYISSTTRGFTAEDLADYYKERFPKVIRLLAEYGENATVSQEARGLPENLALMSNLTMTHFRWGGTDSRYYRGDELVVAVENKIVRLYQKTGWVLFWAGLAGSGGLLFTAVLQRVRGKRSKEQMDLLLVALGLAGSCALLMMAVTWFCNFLPERKAYDYLCAAIPLMETVEVIGGYFFVCAARRFKKLPFCK